MPATDALFSQHGGESQPSSPTPTLDGAAAYRSALSQAGGREVEAQTRSNDRSAISVGLYAAPPYDLRVPALPVSRLSMALTPTRATSRFDGERWRSHVVRRNGLFLIPQHATTYWQKESSSRHVNIYFHADALRVAELGRGYDGFGRLPMENVVVPGTARLLDELVTELSSPTPFSAEATDSLARLLLVKVGRYAGGHDSATKKPTQCELGRLRDYVMAHLAERILVADLAAVIGLSANRFAHVFSASTGRSPHQFVIGLRLEMAQDLLAHSRLGLAEIASTCGFSSQQHMTATMQRQVGTTPGQLRRLRASPLPERS
jgi:AraC family transcriptional regulator